MSYRTCCLRYLFIGYHISAVVNAAGTSSIVTSTSSSAPSCRTKMAYNVSVRVDRSVLNFFNFRSSWYYSNGD